jgi:uncharacterized protein YidB (DUF937 family)
MNFFGNLVNAVLAGFESNTGPSGALAREILQRFQQNEGGGLAGMVEQLSKKGLGDIVQSWVGSGPNRDVSPDQLGQALDKNLLTQLAAKLGIPPQAVTAHLADVLPKIVDRLTPDGKLPGDFAAASAGPGGDAES